jgi:hypothetical protein
LLERATAGEDVWIITGDADYRAKHGHRLYLNPLLRAELEARCGAAKIRCFANLADGIPAFADETTVGKASIPPPEVLEDIRTREERAAVPNETPPTLLPTPPPARPTRESMLLRESVGAV